MPSLVMHCSAINLAVSPNHIITVHDSDHVAAHVRTSSKPPLQSEIHDLLEGTVSLVQYTALQIAVLFVYRLMHMNMSVGAVLDCVGLITEHTPTYIQYIHT